MYMAGVRYKYGQQEKGETRLDLVAKNKKIFASIIPKIAKAAPDAILIIVI